MQCGHQGEHNQDVTVAGARLGLMISASTRSYIGEASVGLNQRRGPDSRWRSAKRGEADGRVPAPRPGEEPSTFGSFQACPVAADVTGFSTELEVLPTGWSLMADESFDLEHLLVSAEQFITQFHVENRAGPPDSRLEQVRRQIAETGTYWHTPAELAFGARVAWRNSSRCIGRLYWRSLRVRDRREVNSARGVAAESVTHLREATNGGRIRPVITVFAPDAPGRPGPRILNSQLLQYAGYETSDGAVIGDPVNVNVTRLAHDLGWSAGWPVSRFDLLPLLVQEAGELATMHELPDDAALEVMIRHPEYGWFADLGLRWYAVPVISDMYLDIGGVRYPAAPFNGWYMCTEIGSRDLGDAGRYDQLPVIARRMGLSTASHRSLWKDKAMTELNVAVLHSYTAAEVTIADHHTESARFLQHIAREERHGRTCPADWTWIVPPTASSATPVFHRYYQDFDQSPNFYRHPPLARVRPTDPHAVTELASMTDDHTDDGVIIEEPAAAAPSPADAPAVGQPCAHFLE